MLMVFLVNSNRFPLKLTARDCVHGVSQALHIGTNMHTLWHLLLLQLKIADWQELIISNRWKCFHANHVMAIQCSRREKEGNIVLAVCNEIPCFISVIKIEMQNEQPNYNYAPQEKVKKTLNFLTLCLVLVSEYSVLNSMIKQE